VPLVHRFPKLARKLYESRFWEGYREWQETGKTGAKAFQALRRLNCLTNGEFNREVASKIAAEGSTARFCKLANPIDWDIKRETERAIRFLRQEGIYLFEDTLPDQYVDSLIHFARRTLARPVPRPDSGPERLRFDSKNLIATRYDVDQTALLRNEVAQQLISDRTFLHIAQQLFGCTPVNDTLGMWWSTSFGDEPCAEARQLFHFDMDRIRLLKFAIYLNDVTPHNGPHVYVRRTHKSKPAHLLLDRFFADDELESLEDNIVELLAPRGTVIAIDGAGLHKSKKLTRGLRLAFEVQFTNSLFGAPHEKPVLSLLHPSLEQRLSESPETFARINAAKASSTRVQQIPLDDDT